MAREHVVTPAGLTVTVLTGEEAHAHVEALGARPGEFTTVPLEELLALNTPERETE